jgi:hypothetical protein
VTELTSPVARWAPILGLVRSAVIGTVLGFLWVGVVGRLVMALIAHNNPAATGRVSDDGFIMGRFTLGGSINFAIVGMVFGVIGGVLYLVLRQLAIGPAWFRVISLSFGPAVVALSQIVHTDGVDFTTLQPALLSVLLFLGVIWGYTASMVVLGERWVPREEPREDTSTPRRLLAWVARGGLAVVFVVALVNVLNDVVDLA